MDAIKLILIAAAVSNLDDLKPLMSALKTEKEGNSFEAVKEAPLDPVEEKLRQQRACWRS
ncbi:hypothetical protein CASFOL_020185 [Castilleja foliolosa]|uniref:Uncharacterized protein n=1 Tax=Castilleja foliolosa TaxID=1961234 RepID=A0ABD3D049_9LAMI